MSVTAKRGSGRSLASATQAAASAQTLQPPSDLPAAALPLFHAIAETKNPHEWRGEVDRKMVAAFARAWLDIEAIEAELSQQTFTIGTKPNPLLNALDARLRAAATLSRMLGLMAPRARTAAEQEVIKRQRGRVRGALAAIDDDDDQLLAGPLN